jgi:CDP-diacylglycerol--glycerol-3-phosphate 3-phosphatidyltransferase
MSASHPRAHDLRRGDSLLSARAKELGRGLLAPVVRLAVRLHLTANTVTVLGFGVVAGAAVLIGTGNLLAGAALLGAGSLLDAVDGALARATGGTTAFGSFLDSTLDRAGESILYTGIGVWLLRTQPDPVLPMLALMVALAGSFLVSYSHARAQGIGLAANVGLAPRTERLVLVIGGVALAGLGFTAGLFGILVILAALTVATVVQRIRHVWHLSAARAADISKET